MYELINNWNIGQILDISQVSQGTSCSTFIVHALQGKYILRGFKQYQQAVQEAEVFRVLQGTGIGAELVYTKNKKAYVFDSEKYYNLQTFLYGEKPNLRNEMQVCATAQTVSELHKALRNCTFSFSAYDRFSTDTLLQQTSEWKLIGELFPKEIATTEQRRKFITSLEQEFHQSQVIHADLGEWNMLWSGNKLQVIDFGECRAGDIYCDLAAVACSILARCNNAGDFNGLLSIFLETYKQGGETINFEKLDKAIYIWLLRGALASSINIQEPIKREVICKHFLKQITRYALYIEGR